MCVFACLEKLVALKSTEQKMRSIVTAQKRKYAQRECIFTYDLACKILK
jgi:hypothetical protein